MFDFRLLTKERCISILKDASSLKEFEKLLDDIGKKLDTDFSYNAEKYTISNSDELRTIALQIKGAKEFCKLLKARVETLANNDTR